MAENQRTWKNNRPQGAHSQAKRIEEMHKSQGAMSASHSQNTLSSSANSAAGANLQFLNTADIFRQHYTAISTAQKSGGSLSASPIPTQVKLQRGSGMFHSAIPAQMMAVKSDKAESLSPSRESLPTPSHTTKSSSLSRDLSPSRITAQVVSAVSAMSESTQPLLRSALTGKIPPPMMLAGTSRPDQDGKPKQPEVSVHRSSPYHMAERRHSPVPEDRRTPPENKGVKGRPMHAALPFEDLMRAAALVQAQEMQERASPTRLSAALLQQAGSSGTLHSEVRTRTPSPKPGSVSASRSPQRHSTPQGHRRSPMGLGSRSSPAPSPSQEQIAVLSSAATLSGGVMIPLPQMGLVQQHLLSNTIASTATTVSTHTRAATSTHTVPHPRIPAAPSVPAVSQAMLKLSTIPIDSTAVATSHKAKSSSKNSHVISVGTETDLKHYSSHAAQCSKVEESVKMKEDNSVAGHIFQSHRKAESSRSGEGVIGVQPTVCVAHSRTENGQGGLAVSAPLSQIAAETMSLSSALNSTSSVGTVMSFSPLSSAAAPLSSGLAKANVEHHNWQVPLPTAAHSNKPISVPSTFQYAHLHFPTSLPYPHIPATSASVVTASVNLVCTTPLAPPTVTMSGIPVTACHSSVSVDAKDPKSVLATVSTQAGSSGSYQPHPHRYHQQGQPTHTITSQTDKSGVSVKDYLPLKSRSEPPPPYPQPSRPSPVNPFKFPPYSAFKMRETGLGDGPAFSFVQEDDVESSVASAEPQCKVARKEVLASVPRMDKKCEVPISRPFKSMSDVSHLNKPCASSEMAERRDEMPRLTPEGVVPSKRELLTKVEALSNGEEQLMSPFNQRVQNLSNFPSLATTQRSVYRSQSVAMQKAKVGITVSAAKTLDLLRQNIQKTLNKELNDILQNYVNTFFKTAVENIRLNNGADAVTEEHINTVCRQALEEAKAMYTTDTRRSLTPIADFPDNISEAGSLNDKRVSPEALNSSATGSKSSAPASKSRRTIEQLEVPVYPWSRTRTIQLPARYRASDSDSEKGSDGGLPKKAPKRKGRPPLNSSGRSTPYKPVAKTERDGPKWDPERIKPDTLFVMGAKANKALGWGNTRGKLYIRHPDIFKYSGDQDDKNWLHEKRLMPATGGKAYILLVEDIVDLSNTEYKDSSAQMMHECQGFLVPEWMRLKIQNSMRLMRADGPKRSRSRSPLAERPEPPKSLPFASFSDTASNNDVDSISNKNSLQPSPADTEEMEFLPAVDNEDTQPSDVSLFKTSGGFEDTSSHSPGPMDSVDDEPSTVPTPVDDDPPISTAFS